MPPSGHQVSDERLEKLRGIYRKVYGEEITMADARAMAHRLLALYDLLRRPLPGDTSVPSLSQEPPARTAPEAP